MNKIQSVCVVETPFKTMAALEQLLHMHITKVFNSFTLEKLVGPEKILECLLFNQSTWIYSQSNSNSSHYGIEIKLWHDYKKHNWVFSVGASFLDENVINRLPILYKKVQNLIEALTEEFPKASSFQKEF